MLVPILMYSRGTLPLKTRKTTKRKVSIGLLSKCCMAGFAMYLTFSFVFMQLEIVTKKQELEALETQIQQQQEVNLEMERLVSAGDGLDFIERIARDRYNYATPNERVFIDISGQ